MEPDNSTRFTIICDHEAFLREAIEWYNNTYKTDFELVRLIDDEVRFAEIKVSKFKLSDIFDLGFQVGVMEGRLKEQKK